MTWDQTLTVWTKISTMSTHTWSVRTTRSGVSDVAAAAAGVWCPLGC